MKNLNFIITVYLINLFSVNGQEGKGCECNDILFQGIYRFRYSESDHKSDDYVRHYLATSSRDVIQNNSNFNGGAKILGFGLTTDMSDQEFSDRQKQLQKEDIYKNTDLSSERLIEKFPDPNIINAWASCKKDCNQLKSGFDYYYTIEQDGSIKLLIEWYNEDYPKEKVLYSSINGGILSGRNSNDKTLDLSELYRKTERHIKRTGKKSIDIFIKINSRKDPIHIHIPALIKPLVKNVDLKPLETMYTCYFEAGTTDAITKSVFEFKCNNNITGSVDQSVGSNKYNGECIIPKDAFCKYLPLEIIPHFMMGTPINRGSIKITKWIKKGDRFEKLNEIITAAIIGRDPNTNEYLFSPRTLIIPAEIIKK